ncbi:MAG: GntR family transcriptional regulator, partial [Nocardioidaceae bacterium]
MAQRDATKGDRRDDARSPEHLAEKLWAEVERNHLEPGDRIGAERELAERYGVGRWVIRKALERLETDGRIIRTNGRNGGAFIAHEKVVRDPTRSLRS